MSATPPLPPLDAPPSPTVRRPTTAAAPAPEHREVLALGALGAVVALAHLASLGERLIGPVLTRDTPAVSSAGAAALVVVANSLPWLLGVIGLGAVYGLRLMPRAHQRLVEPSLIAGWVSVVVGGAGAWVLGRLGVWPWTWTTTAPETATLLTRFAVDAHVAAAGLQLVVICLMIPLLSELVFRHALLERLRAAGHPTWRAIALSSVAFGLWWLAAGWSASPAAAAQQALIATLAGAALGVVAVYARRGRGLGLCVLAHMAWMSADSYALVRSLPFT
ncbi:MAG: CPBP family intramembrane metalloprotease [Gemmatimonadaceae bacterium]|jgi:hypothetical protein|nr:CPBP family intramembrane metalloprotease [Gemmatimonadaceae bacterium]